PMTSAMRAIRRCRSRTGINGAICGWNEPRRTGQRMTGPIDRLLAIMARLRDPACGCPWDREQDFATIAPYTIEEAYEVADAIERGDMNALKDELGDLLLQVVFHARMAEEAGHFVFDDVAEAIAELEVELDGGADAALLQEEMGDLLFAAANLARKLDIEPETALRQATSKFERRFRRVEALAKERGLGPHIDALEALWQEVK